MLGDSVAWLVTQLMDAEVGELTGAELGARAPLDRRQTQRNGDRARPKGFDGYTSIGEPVTRGCASLRTRSRR